MSHTHRGKMNRIEKHADTNKHHNTPSQKEMIRKKNGDENIKTEKKETKTTSVW